MPVRVMAVHRSHLAVAAPAFDQLIPTRTAPDADEDERPTTGDWILLDRQSLRLVRVLRRKSVFKRRAAGTGRALQLIAANVDTLFVVSSCNQDFNIARLERYLVLARDAEVTPVIVLTKADLAENPKGFTQAAHGLQAGLMVETVDGRDPASVAGLAVWCGPGQTVAVLGSSGVGKSTLVNTLTGVDAIGTQAVRVDDDKGRHTTRARSLHRMPQGGWLLDTPGMRELQLTDAAAGLDDVFADIIDLANGCRFSDCTHDNEPGCAVQAAIAGGTLEADRLKRWRKLLAEERHNTASLAERRARDRAFGRMVKDAMQHKRRGEF